MPSSRYGQIGLLKGPSNHNSVTLSGILLEFIICLGKERYKKYSHTWEVDCENDGICRNSTIDLFDQEYCKYFHNRLETSYGFFAGNGKNDLWICWFKKTEYENKGIICNFKEAWETIDLLATAVKIGSCSYLFYFYPYYFSDFFFNLSSFYFSYFVLGHVYFLIM